MAPLSYLLVVSLMGSTIKPKDVTFEIDKVSKLVENLAKAANNNEAFSLLDAMEKSYVKKGHEAKYFSNNLRDYILHGNVSSDEEGFILSMDYRDSINSKDNIIKENKNDYLALFVPRTKEALYTTKEEIETMIERNLAKTHDARSHENSSVEKKKDEFSEESNTYDTNNSVEKISNRADIVSTSESALGENAGSSEVTEFDEDDQISNGKNDLADEVITTDEVSLEENAETTEVTEFDQNSDKDDDEVESKESENTEEEISVKEVSNEETDFD